METRPDPDTRELVSSDDALRELCFSDAVFRQRYDGWQVLGRGPWATVVRTRSRDLGQDIALKVFVNLDPEFLERVRQEVRAVQALATPYLVHSYSVFDRGTAAWFEMELVEGRNLRQELDRLAATGSSLPMVRAYEESSVLWSEPTPASQRQRPARRDHGWVRQPRARRGSRPGTGGPRPLDPAPEAARHQRESGRVTRRPQEDQWRGDESSQ